MHVRALVAFGGWLADVGKSAFPSQNFFIAKTLGDAYTMKKENKILVTFSKELFSIKKIYSEREAAD